jgi:hypothetical protein
MEKLIKPGQPWLDTEGRPIQAHGASIFYENGIFYWYGEDRSRTIPGSGIYHWGVRAYSSNDLTVWKDEGLILPPDENDRGSPVHPSRNMDRPHILYNDRTKQYVMWIKIINTGETDHYVQYMTIAAADRFLGPYKIVKTLHPLGMNSGDFDLVMDESGHKAYIYFERVHSELICADLAGDFLGLTGYYSTHFPRKQPPFVREAPAFFKRKGKMYLITSGTTGFFPNPSEAAEADSFHGPWTLLGDPHINDRSHRSFNSQISSVFRHPYKKDLYIALADRWIPNLPEDLPDMGSLYKDLFDPEKKDLPNREKMSALAAQTTSHLASYVWLPLKFTEEGRPLIEWVDEWRIDDYE